MSTAKENSEKISALLKEIHERKKQIEALAEESGITVYIDFDHGLSGVYLPETLLEKRRAKYRDGDFVYDDKEIGIYGYPEVDDAGWYSSSYRC